MFLCCQHSGRRLQGDLAIQRNSTTTTMACRSPLRLPTSIPDISGGFLYRRGGKVVRQKEVGGISCRSSVCTQILIGLPISHWKPGPNCQPEEADPSCDGAEHSDDLFRWQLPISAYRVIDENGTETETCDFVPRWDGNRCDSAHCIIVLHHNGRELSDFSGLSEAECISLSAHLKRQGKQR